jgi:hypothetical protein
MKPIPHNWRKLPKTKRLRIPLEYFEIPESEVKRIRNITDSKKRLIESARLQVELFGNIHADLTAWIAGYASDVILRQIIGSTQKLRDMVIEPLLKNSKFEPSWQDRRRNIKLPNEMDNDLAEECGIHIGDGNLNLNKHKWGYAHKYDINGNLKEEYDYHTIHIAKLMKKLYNCKGYFSLRENRNGIESVYKSKIIFEYKTKVLEFPSGNKLNILIPKQILGNDEFEKKCVCGIFDTDFNLGESMNLNGRMASLKLLNQIKGILSKHNVEYTYRKYKGYGDLRIRSKDSIDIIEEWKLNNDKHLTKYWIWKETKKYFPYTTTSERWAFLKGKIGLEILEKIMEERRKIASVKRSASR